MMSLRWQIMGSMAFVIVLTVLINISVGYYSSQSRLNVLVDQIGEDEAIQLARNLSREYSATGGWATVDYALSEAGYIYDGDREGEGEGHGESEGEASESFHRDQIRVVITGIDGRVVRDNLSDVAPGTAAPDLEGRREAVFDLSTNRVVGYVHVDVNREFLATESRGFLNTLLLITLIGGSVTAGIAILLAARLSKRITTPVTALTDATQAIAHGDTTRLPVTSSDEVGRMSAAFNQMTSTLESQRELRRRLINDVSHELNTPLSVIQLEATGLRDGLQTPAEASDQIINEVDRLRGLTTDLDWLAETDSGELRLNFQASSVSALLSAELNRWKSQALAEQVELLLHVSNDTPEIDLDVDRMSQALGNLIRNALHATEKGGKIVLRAAPDSNKQLTISISDDGAGIDPEDLPHVFDRFYRTDQSRSRRIGGSGLGLAITRAIVEAHGGTIAIASEGLGNGATATISLPLNRPSSSPSDMD